MDLVLFNLPPKLSVVFWMHVWRVFPRKTALPKTSSPRSTNRFWTTYLFSNFQFRSFPHTILGCLLNRNSRFENLETRSVFTDRNPSANAIQCTEYRKFFHYLATRQTQHLSSLSNREYLSFFLFSLLKERLFIAFPIGVFSESPNLAPPQPEESGFHPPENRPSQRPLPC